MAMRTRRHEITVLAESNLGMVLTDRATIEAPNTPDALAKLAARYISPPAPVPSPQIGAVNGSFTIIAVIPARTGPRDWVVTGHRETAAGPDEYVTWRASAAPGRLVYSSGDYSTAENARVKSLQNMFTRAGYNAMGA